MKYSVFANRNQNLVALVDGVRLPIVGWRIVGTQAGLPIVPMLDWSSDSFPPVLDTNTNFVYTRKGVTTLEHYEESVNG